MSAATAARPQWLEDVVAAAAGRAVARRPLEAGLPGRHAEAWKYTRLDALARGRFVALDVAPAVFASALPAAAGARLVFAGGYLIDALSRLDALPAGVTVRTVAPDTEPALAERFFPALSRAAARAGVLIEAAAGARCEAPIEVVHLGLANVDDVLATSVLTVRAGEGAMVRLTEHCVVPDAAGAALTVPLAAVHVAPGATVEHLLVLDCGPRGHHIASTDVHVQSDARYRAWVLAGGGAVVRQDLDVTLGGAGAACDLAVVYTAGANDQSDVHACVNHAAPDTTSRVRARGVASGHGRAVFNGRVHVSPGANGTDARLDTGNLLLSAHAEVNAKPELEIYADDVKCAHGATVGQLDADQRYYLASRGIAPDDARALLIGAFTRDVFTGIDAAFPRALLDGAIATRLAHLAALASP